MRISGPINTRKVNLQKIAQEQYGYFTANQAVKHGYSKDNHSYHVNRGNWLRIDHGLFRLPGQPDCPEAEYARWFLWSRNQNGQPQGVVSHASALALYGLAEFDLENVHLTVPPTFVKKAPAGCILHKMSLNLSAVESRPGFMATRLPRTLADLQPQLIAAGRWDEILRQTAESGALSRDEAAQLGYEPAPTLAGAVMAGGLTPSAEPLSPLSVAGENPPAVELSALAEPEQRRERVFEMIYQRTWKRPESRRREAGFTLVELLVVVAIITILAGMLLPALEKAVSSARQAACQSNFKQLGVAFTCYAGDYQGYLPWAWLAGTSGSTASWHKRIYRYFDETLPLDAVYSRVDRLGIYCPSAEKTGYLSATYAMNQRAGGIDPATGMPYTYPPYRHCKMERAKEPSTIFLAGEKEPDTCASGYAISSWTFSPTPAQCQTNYEYRIGLHHNNGSNWLFLDMHVEWRTGFRVWSYEETGGRLKTCY